jgi:methylmalonyl-CoA mutase N-terminal domain/subunit
MNNVVRTSVEMLAAALGGIQTMHVSAFDEALGVPTEEAAMLALRTQQVIAFETGVLSTADPLAGSYEIERLTDELADAMWALLEDIEKKGGALACINDGWFATQLSDKAYEFAMSIDSGERKLVGVNIFKADTPPYAPFEINPESEAGQVKALQNLRAKRDNSLVQKTLSDLHDVAKSGENIMEACIAAVRAYATVGEIVDELRKVYGKWQPSRTF